MVAFTTVTLYLLLLPQEGRVCKVFQLVFQTTNVVYVRYEMLQEHYISLYTKKQAIGKH